MPVKSGQKFIRQNRAPRVHIEYEVETGGATKKIELPFKMGVLSDLSGKSLKERDDIETREMVGFDMDNFDAEMADIAPRVATTVKNVLTGEGQLGIDLTFHSMDDFNPGQIAKNIPALARLLEQRAQLAALLSFMDGKAGAEKMLQDILANKEMQEVLAATKAARAAQTAEGANPITNAEDPPSDNA